MAQQTETLAARLRSWSDHVCFFPTYRVGDWGDVGVQRIVLLSFLRARPDGPTSYHRSKWAAEEIVRASGIAHTVLKAGVIHGRGDHMLDHLSHALHTFPVFGLVGMHERPVRPVAVDDIAKLLEAAALGDPRLRDRTIAVLGPDELTLGAAVRRVADAVGRRPVYVRLPIAGHLALARVCEAVMRVPLISLAQVHILAEGVTVPAPFAEPPPADLAPDTPFDAAIIRAGLPAAGGFGRRDLRWCRPPAAGVRSFRDPSDRQPEIDEVPIVVNGKGQTLGWRELEEGVEVGSVDADAQARLHLKAVAATLQQSIKRADARVYPAALDAGDGLLRDPGLRGEGALGQLGPVSSVTKDPARHRHR